MICALALVLLMDVSASMSDHSYRLQRDGVRDAFLNPQLQQIIEREPDGVAITVIEWASTSVTVVPWQHLRTTSDVTEFAQKVSVLNRAAWGFTALGNAVHHALNEIEHAPCEPDRSIIDVSGDGVTNEGVSATHARDRAHAQGVIINGLPILAHDNRDMEMYYRENVITPGGFVIVAHGFEDFARAIRRKLVLEITSR